MVFSVYADMPGWKFQRPADQISVVASDMKAGIINGTTTKRLLMVGDSNTILRSNRKSALVLLCLKRCCKWPFTKAVFLELTKQCFVSICSVNTDTTDAAQQVYSLL
jgi:hypothetical protein